MPLLAPNAKQKTELIAYLSLFMLEAIRVHASNLFSIRSAVLAQQTVVINRSTLIFISGGP